jgi:hypothetical protein
MVLKLSTESGEPRRVCVQARISVEQFKLANNPVVEEQQIGVAI